MRKLLVIVAGVGLLALVALNVAWLIDYGRFVKRLRLRHPEHWRSVGSPVQFEDEPGYGKFGFFGYFTGRKYAELEDSELTVLGDRLLGKPKLMLLCVLASSVCITVALGGTG